MPGVMDPEPTPNVAPAAPVGENADDSGVLEECIMAPGRVREMVALFSEVAARQALRRSLRRGKEHQRNYRSKGSYCFVFLYMISWSKKLWYWWLSARLQ